MKIEKYKDDGWFYHYYVDSKTGDWIYHGLRNYSVSGIGYNYHNIRKGFWLRKKYIL